MANAKDRMRIVLANYQLSFLGLVKYLSGESPSAELSCSAIVGTRCSDLAITFLSVLKILNNLFVVAGPIDLLCCAEFIGSGLFDGNRQLLKCCILLLVTCATCSFLLLLFQLSFKSCYFY